MEHMIGRTEKVKQLREALKTTQIIYLSGFFSSGKTVLLDQLAHALGENVLRFDAEKDDWAAFELKARQASGAVLLIDTLNRIGGDEAEQLKTLLNSLTKGQRAVLAGRGQMPDFLHAMHANSLITVFDRDFILFEEEEIRQLFLSYGIVLKPVDVNYLHIMAGGWPTMLHSTAQLLAQDPQRPVRDVIKDVAQDLRGLVIRDVVMAFPEDERLLLFNLSPFERFTGEMARMVTGRIDAPQVMEKIASKSWMLLRERQNYSFIPFVRNALLQEMENMFSPDYISNLYRSAALYYELKRDIPQSAHYYIMLRDTEKVRALLINDTHMRPSSGDYVELKEAYSLLPREAILSSPELMKGMCLMESMSCHIEESEYWYGELKKFIKNTPPRDGRRATAQEAVAYLDICLAHRGTGHILQTLLATAKSSVLTDSSSWRGGFNVGGNSVSLMNGGKDFCRWVPHGKMLYRLCKTPVEMALGRGGSGMADIAIGECELESSLTGDYAQAMDHIALGLNRSAGDLEMNCAALGIQCRLLAAQGCAVQAAEMIENRLLSLPEEAPARLRQNLTAYQLTLRLMTGDVEEAFSWLSYAAPNETKGFSILDRYCCLLKLRLYIIDCQWDKTLLLTSLLRNYFEQYDRPFMRIQLHLLQAVIDRRQGKDAWKSEMRSALDLARHYRLVRVIADEGIAVLDMLKEMDLQNEPWENAVQELTRRTALMYPQFMKPMVRRPEFSDKEYMVYSLLTTGVSTAEIARLLNMKERTVKYYLTSIYQALGVKTRSEALKRAAELGDI